MVHLAVSWLLSALALWIVGKTLRGFEVRGFGDALIAAVVIAVVNAVLGPILRFIGFPLTILTFGLFRLVINAILLKLAAALSPGFRIDGFLPALVGSIVLSLLTSFLQVMVF